MYQCAAMVLASDPENEADDIVQHLVGDEEEVRGREHHHEHAASGHQRLLARRPGDLGAFGAHLLQELNWVFHLAILQAPPQLPLRARQSGARPKRTGRGAVWPRATSNAYISPQKRFAKG